MIPVRRSNNWLPSVFGDFFDKEFVERANSTSPAINVLETEDNFKIELAAPGMKKENFDIHVDEEENLVIAMEDKQENTDEEKDGRYLRREFSYSKFQQTIILPDTIDKEHIDAKVEHGILRVLLPKLKEEEIKKAQRMIEVK